MAIFERGGIFCPVIFSNPLSTGLGEAVCSALTVAEYDATRLPNKLAHLPLSIVVLCIFAHFLFVCTILEIQLDQRRNFSIS